jgi:hypothetical protein
MGSRAVNCEFSYSIMVGRVILSILMSFFSDYSLIDLELSFLGEFMLFP